MTAPYAVGDAAVRFLLIEDRVEVYTTEIKGVERFRDGWRVYDHIGKPHEVDSEGVGAELVPLDGALRAELLQRGEGFRVVEEERLSGLELVEEMPEPSLDGGRDVS